jgi:hypothetical protein
MALQRKVLRNASRPNAHLQVGYDRLHVIVTLIWGHLVLLRHSPYSFLQNIIPCLSSKWCETACPSSTAGNMLSAVVFPAKR